MPQPRPGSAAGGLKRRSHCQRPPALRAIPTYESPVSPEFDRFPVEVSLRGIGPAGNVDVPIDILRNVCGRQGALLALRLLLDLNNRIHPLPRRPGHRLSRAGKGMFSSLFVYMKKSPRSEAKARNGQQSGRHELGDTFAQGAMLQCYTLDPAPLHVGPSPPGCPKTARTPKHVCIKSLGAQHA